MITKHINIDIYINSVAGYLHEVLDYTNDEKGKNNTFFFRGHAYKWWDLKPSAFRNEYLDNEDFLYYQSSSLLSEEFSADMTTFDKLIKMQHYQIPTRLLDVTTNPLIALYFACCEGDKKDDKKEETDDYDACILCFKVPTREIKNYDSDCVAMLSNLAKCKKETIMWELVHQIKQERDFEEKYIDREDLNRSFFVNPKRNNDRIKAQSGAFIIVGGVSISPHDTVTKKVMEPEYPNFVIGIKNGMKQKILDELNFLGVNKGNLYCDMEYKFKNIVNGL